MSTSKTSENIKDIGEVGFIGLGQMGSGIVENLLSKGVMVSVFDKNTEVLAKFKSLGAHVADSPEGLARTISILFLCLPFTPEINNVLFGDLGVTNAVNKNLVIVDTSTIYFDDAQAIAQKLQKYGISYVDCPISGLPKRAKNGSLTMMFGGSSKIYNKVLKYLNLMGDFIIHCGPCGSGQMMKAFNNAVYNINIAGISEVLPLAVKAGLDPKALEKLLVSGSSRSFASEYFIPKMMKREFTGDYRMEDAFKDIVNIQRATSDISAEMPLIEGMIKIYKEALEKGFGQSSKSAMLKVYEEKYGLKISSYNKP